MPEAPRLMDNDERMHRKHMKTVLIISVLICALAAHTQPKAYSKDKLCHAAIALTNQRVTYDAAYTTIPYPNGDVAPDKGVCTDVVIRAYRMLGVDLQKLVHEDMAGNFSKYPRDWNAKQPDKNIDHRRVPNLMTFFARKGRVLAITPNAADYNSGDIVTWDLGGGTTHIGIVIDQKSADGSGCLIVHNIGNGQEISDCLFKFKIIGHYRYLV